MVTIGSDDAVFLSDGLFDTKGDRFLVINIYAIRVYLSIVEMAKSSNFSILVKIVQNDFHSSHGV